MKRLGVLGAGSWGTALAVHYAEAGASVLLGARDPEAAAELEAAGRNE
ncbi:MAG: NAD(P)-binding domain-containing protein, partial [Thermoanaerobaculia bacterium]|nr:NAD(P)-binding domain-containing protein [Thermoanaerobaculia bacterium]